MDGMKLPALRSLGNLADHEPVIVIDSREQRSLPFERLKTKPGTLTTGDYSIAGLEELFAVERKSIDGLAGCCLGKNRERFERELHRLRGYRFKRLLVVGSEEDIFRSKYWSGISPKSVLATLAAFEVRFSVPVVLYTALDLRAVKSNPGPTGFPESVPWSVTICC
jgi:DNA excision repair protein ERCC-4